MGRAQPQLVHGHAGASVSQRRRSARTANVCVRAEGWQRVCSMSELQSQGSLLYIFLKLCYRNHLRVRKDKRQEKKQYKECNMPTGCSLGVCVQAVCAPA